MTLVFIILGALFGAELGGLGGALIGALAGFLLARALEQRSTSDAQQKRSAGSGAASATAGRGEAGQRDLQSEIDALRARVEALEHALGERAAAVPEAQPAAAATPSAEEPFVEAPVWRRPVSAPEPELQPEAPAAQEQAATPRAAPAADTPPPSRPVLADDLASRAFNFVRDWFTTGNVVVKVGIIILFFGVAFLVKYVAERTHVPIELRLMGIALGAVAMLAVGWRLRLTRPAYALAIQGGGVGVLYLVIFAAFRLYGLLPDAGAFALLAAVAALSAMLAVLQDARSLAVLGAAGGFLAPVLASTGGGSHVGLFTYYALINAGILGIAWYRAWRELNLVGWLFTFAIAGIWGARFYQPEHFATTEPFLVLFFLFYVGIAILFASRQPPQLRGLVDGTLVFGTPLVAFGMQTWLTRGMEFGAAISAATAGGFYILLARSLLGRDPQTWRLLAEAFLALGVVFVTLAVPLALEGRWTAAVWALEGAGIYWVGVRQGRMAARAFGLCLQVLAGVAFLGEAGRRHVAPPVLNASFLGAVLVSAAGWVTARLMHRAAPESLRPGERLMWPAAIWAIAWWYLAGLPEIERALADRLVPAASLGFAAASSSGFVLADRRLDWAPLKAGAMLIVPAMLLAFLAWLLFRTHPSQAWGWAAWPASFAAGWWALHRCDGSLPKPVHAPSHLAVLWLLLALVSWELSWQTDAFVAYQGVWAAAALAVAPVAYMAMIARGRGPAWPVQRHFALYAGSGATPVALALLAWGLLANFTQDGAAEPLPYLPLLNPLDLVIGATLLAIAHWGHAGKRDLALQPLARIEWRVLYALLGVPAFAWLNGMLLRSLHHYADLPFRLGPLLRSTLVQASFSLLWALTALVLMVVAARRALRPLWLVGAALLAVVVVKLFTVDIANVGGMARIVSFIGVALLMLVIGYVAPLPPRRTEKDT